MIEQKVREAIIQAYHEARLAKDLQCACPDMIDVSRPKQSDHGDYASNIALAQAKAEQKKPREIAEILRTYLVNNSLFANVDVAGPGFINFSLHRDAYLKFLSIISEQGDCFGSSEFGKGKKIQIEFVSANPTGPLHIGHGRGAIYGDALASILKKAGYDVTKEYYVNDAGVQMRTLGLSVFLRALELKGQKISFPEDCYQGDYIISLAADVLKQQANLFCDEKKEEAIAFCGSYAGDLILAEIKQDLKDVGVEHDVYFFETELHKANKIQEALDYLQTKGFLFEQDGALWFKSQEFGDDKDRVLRKSDGSLTYFAADIAYHYHKYQQGFDRVIDIWGADHGGYVKRMEAAVQAMGYSADHFQAVLIQLVNLLRKGELVSMSTRRATYETLADVTKMIGKDVCRYFFLMRSHQAQLDFDLELARTASPDNPVFYIQYAHARIASIFRKADSLGIKLSSSPNLQHLSLPAELELVRFLLEYPKVLLASATYLEPHRVAFYLLDLARKFQTFYSLAKSDDRYRVLSDDKAISEAKLYLLKNIQIVLRSGLTTLGISAPEEMSREQSEESREDV